MKLMLYWDKKKDVLSLHPWDFILKWSKENLRWYGVGGFLKSNYMEKCFSRVSTQEADTVVVQGLGYISRGQQNLALLVL